MGVDIYGRRPSSSAGKYYAANWTYWRELAHYFFAIAPVEASQCEGWFRNDGDGLDAGSSLSMAEKLDKAILDGTFESYTKEFNN